LPPDRLVSVLIPCHRARDTLARAVASLHGQGDWPWEAVVVADDGGDYRPVLAAAGLLDDRIRFTATVGPPRGPSAARNAGLAAARGALVAPLDADDLWLPGRLAVLAPAALEAGAAFDNVRVVRDGDGAAIATAFPEAAGFDRIDAGTFLAGSVPLMPVARRAALAPWDDDLGFAEDLVFNLRLIDRLGPLPLARTALHEYRVRDGSLCHGAGSAERAEAAYGWCLDRLAADGLGLGDAAIRAAFARALRAKRDLNRAFARWRDARGGGTFQDYVALPEADRA